MIHSLVEREEPMLKKGVLLNQTEKQTVGFKEKNSKNGGYEIQRESELKIPENQKRKGKERKKYIKKKNREKNCAGCIYREGKRENMKTVFKKIKYQKEKELLQK